MHAPQPRELASDFDGNVDRARIHAEQLALIDGIFDSGEGFLNFEDDP